MDFIGTAPKKTLEIIENIQYYYECYDGAKKRQEMQAMDAEMARDVPFEDEATEDDLTIDVLGFCPTSVGVTEEDIEVAYETRGLMRERLHAEVAVNIGLDFGVFPATASHTTFLPPAEKAHPSDLDTFRRWHEQLKAVCRSEAEGGKDSLFASIDGAAAPAQCGPGVTDRARRGQENIGQEHTLERPKRELLKKDQRRAHDIVENQLLKRLAGKLDDDTSPPQQMKKKTDMTSRRKAQPTSNACAGTWRYGQVDAHWCNHRDIQSTWI